MPSPGAWIRAQPIGQHHQTVVDFASILANSVPIAQQLDAFFRICPKNVLPAKRIRPRGVLGDESESLNVLRAEIGTSQDAKHSAAPGV